MGAEWPVRGKRLAWAVAAVAALGLAGLYLWRGMGVPSPAVQRLTIAVSTTPHAALLQIAQVQGFFAAEGLEVKFLPVTHGKAALALVAGQQAQLATAAEVPFVISVMKGQRLDIAATVASVSTEMAVVARRDRDIAEARDLAGKTVGVTSGTSGEYFLWAFLIRNRVSPERVRLQNLVPTEMSQALASGQVDAISTWQPVVLGAQKAAGAQALTLTATQAYRVTHVVVGDHEFLTRHPQVVEKFLRALLRAERFNRDHPQQAMALVAQWLKLDPQALWPAWKEIDFRVDLRQSQLITMEDEAQWAVARGHVKSDASMNFLPRFYLAGLLSVFPQRVTVVH